jgi:hypothetical protein
LGLILVALLSVPALAAATAFGAKLTTSTQPQDATTCHSQDELDIPAGGVCTWVAQIAFENGSHITAPKNGTLHTLKLVSCDAGKFTLQLVKKSATGNRFQALETGPQIFYKADPRQIDGNPDTECGGPDGNDYIIQTFPISVPVKTGEFIAVRTAKLGLLHCSGDPMPIYFPALAVGQGFRTAVAGAGCGLLVRLQY